MANIYFVRIYDFYGSKHCDVAYERDGFITKVCTYPTDEMPKTVKKWLEDKPGRVQYNRTLKRSETIYVARYEYGMRCRGYSIGCQPTKRLVDRKDDPSGRYYDILIYDRKLSDQELYDYELDYLGKDGDK